MVVGQGALLTDGGGVVQREFRLTSSESLATVRVRTGTTALTAQGNPLTELRVQPEPDSPPSPSDQDVIGLAYDFGPSGATFDRPVTLFFGYYPVSLPAGVAEADLLIGSYNPDAGRWESISNISVFAGTHIIAGTVGHFSVFAVFPETPPAPPPVFTGGGGGGGGGAVADVNDPPAITSTPVTTATQGQPYAYDVEAVDADTGSG